MTPARASVYGATTGDLIHLGDTGLLLRVEADSDSRGDEFTVGFGKTARDGMHLKAAAVAETCDTTIIAGDGLIVTAGAVDTHVHLISPRILEASLASGVTTIIGQEFGPVWGVGVNSPWALSHAFSAFDAWPVNVGFLARGSSSSPAPLIEALEEGGASGLKVHEDLGAHPRAIDTALRVADDYDVQVALHSDGLNEAGCVADTIAVLDGRTVHAFHVEGCGGGHVPDVMRLAGRPNVIASSTNPTLPYGRDAVAEHFDMICACHGLHKTVPSDARMARDRVRGMTMGAEDVLHDMGMIAITSSDAQGMGRAGETFRRTVATASKMKGERGHLGPAGDDDNERILRYMAKLTINPAIAHGLSHEVGSIEVGKLADLVLWEPMYFGAKPMLVLKAGFPAWGVTGDPNATIESSEPLVFGPQFGGMGATAAELSVAFIADASLGNGADRMPTKRRRVAVRGTRGIGPAAMVRNTALGEVEVDARTGAVAVDGRDVSSEPARSICLNRLYFL